MPTPLYTTGTGGHLAQRFCLCDGDENLQQVCSRTVGGCSKDVGPVAARAAASLREGRPHVEPGFVTGQELHGLRVAAASLAGACGPRELPAAVLGILADIEALRRELARATGRELRESAEMQLVRYEAGGAYRTHVDDHPSLRIGASGRTDIRRSLSILLYLTSPDWQPAADGGALRVYHTRDAQQASPAARIDVQALPGTLVVFDSRVPHEVLTTRRERTLIAGWLHEGR